MSLITKTVMSEKVGTERDEGTVVQGEWVAACVLPCLFETGSLQKQC